MAKDPLIIYYEQEFEEQAKEVRRRTREDLLANNKSYTDVDVAFKDAIPVVAQYRFPGWTRRQVVELAKEIALDIAGYGPIHYLMEDDEISEIGVNGTTIWYERRGIREFSASKFRDLEHVRMIMDRILLRSGKSATESNPMVDAFVFFGGVYYRVNIVVYPLVLQGPVITIRKFRKNMDASELVRFGSIDEKTLEFLFSCVKHKLNIVVSGGTGTGKTTMLNILGQAIDKNERVIVIQEIPELQIRTLNTVEMFTRSANVEGVGEISIRELVKNSLRMSPDRIIIGESRTGEAFDLLVAMNTGHSGSMTSVHANSAYEALKRFENMVLMAKMDIPYKAIMDQIASAIDIIVHLKRNREGKRYVEEIISVNGIHEDGYSTTRLYKDGRLEIQECRALLKMEDFLC